MLEVERRAGEPSSGEVVQGKRKKKKKEIKELKENGDHLFEEVVDGESAENEESQRKMMRKHSEQSKVSHTSTREREAVSEQLKSGGRKRGASSGKTELPQVEVEELMEDEVSEPKPKISTPGKRETDSLGLFADLSTGDWGVGNDGEDDSKMPFAVSTTPSAAGVGKSSRTKSMKKGKVKHVKIRKAVRVTPLATARTNDSSGVDSSVMEEEGENGGRDSARLWKSPQGASSVSPNKRVSFKPQQLYTVQGVCV